MPWSQYGPWIWHPQYQRYYRQRQNHLGERETEWGPDYSAADTPSEFPVVSSNDVESDEKKKKRRRRRGKGKITKNAEADSDSDSDQEHHAHTEYEYPTAQPAYTEGLYPTYTNPEPTSHSIPSAYGLNVVKPTQSYDSEHESSAQETPVVHDQQDFYADPDGDDENDKYVIDSEEGRLRVDEINIPLDDGISYEGDESSEDQRIIGREGECEVLDPRYRVCNSNAFQPGEVFKVLWSEPIGKSATNGGSTTVSDTRTFVDSYGEKFYVGFRRFIVVANDAGHCTCVPILTYGGRGCRKSGVKPDRHGIVVQSGHKARPVPGEPTLGFPPIHIDIHARGERLTKESRVNYSKLVTVEHNVKVFFVGTVAAEDTDNVQDAVDKCWRRKSFHRRAHP